MTGPTVQKTSKEPHTRKRSQAHALTRFIAVRKLAEGVWAPIVLPARPAQAAISGADVVGAYRTNFGFWVHGWEGDGGLFAETRR